jgi:hypothetical protein
MSLKSTFKTFGKFVKKNGKKIAGGVITAVGAVASVTGVGAAIGGPVAALGVKMLATAKKVKDSGIGKVAQVVGKTAASVAKNSNSTPQQKAMAGLPPNVGNANKNTVGNKKLFGLGNKITNSGFLNQVQKIANKTSGVIGVIQGTDQEQTQDQQYTQSDLQSSEMPVKKGVNPIVWVVGGLVAIIGTVLIIKSKKR